MTSVLLLFLLFQAPAPAQFLPDPDLTPGDTMPITWQQMCAQPHYTDTIRKVSADDRREAFARYGLKPSAAYELDHLIPLVLGGTNDAKRNLWPQSYSTKPFNARVKDALENRLRRQVCWGSLPLAEAQRAIRTNWIEAYKRFVK